LKRRPDPPEQLVERLAANAATWERILGVDASALALLAASRR
jgi:hypothetical protein